MATVSRAARGGEARGAKPRSLAVARVAFKPAEAPLAPLRTWLAPPPPPQAPQPQLFVLANGGKGIGKAECVGSVVLFVRSGASGWVTVRLVSVALRSRGGKAALRVGDELQWRRSALRAMLPNNTVAAEAPTMEELLAAAAPIVAPLAPPPLPPLMPTLLGELPAAVARVVVLFDLEGGRPITQMAATGVYALADGTWGVPPNGRFGTHVTRANSFSDAAGDLNAFLERMSAGAGGAPLTILAHSGHGSDWPKLGYALTSIGSALPECVTTLGCTQHLFVAELAAELGIKWKMSILYAARFGGAKIPNAHQALGDVSAMERILVHAISVNGSDWAQAELDAAVKRGKPPAFYIAKYGAEFGVRQAPAAVQAKASAAVPPLPVQKADPLECDHIAKLRAACSATFGTVPESRSDLWRALRSAAALPAESACCGSGAGARGARGPHAPARHAVHLAAGGRGNAAPGAGARPRGLS